jgi:ketosteroid isomerase-like protein
MAPTNVETVRGFFDAYLRRDRAAVVALVHPDVEWHSVASSVVGVGVLHGLDELLTFMFEQISFRISRLGSRS